MGDLLHQLPACRFGSSREAVSQPAITSVTPSKYPLNYVTKGYVTGTSKAPTLTSTGKNFLRLVSGEF